MTQPGDSAVEVATDRQPAEGEVLIFTSGGGFSVKGTMQEVVQRFASEEWPTFELAESGDHVVIRSSQVVALRGGSQQRRGTIGFVHRS